MRDQEIIGLMEAYQQVCEAETARGPRLIDAYDKPPYSDDAAVAKNPVKMKRKGPKMKGVVSKEEVETDLFDYLLEYLVAEGYADTNKAALAIMANMSEEWKEEIVEGLDKAFGSMRKRGGASAPPEERSVGGEMNRKSKDYWADTLGKNRDRGKGSKAKRRAAELG